MDENPHKGVPRCPPSFLQLSPNALPTSSDLASIISSGDNSLLVSKSSFIAFEHNILLGLYAPPTTMPMLRV